MRPSKFHVVKRFWMSLGCAVLLWGTVQPSTAAVIQANDSIFGIDSVIRDVSNSREFLQLVHTSGRGYGAVSSELGVGGDFEGWTIATISVLDALSASAGVTHGSTDPGQIAIAEQLRDWFCIRGAISCVSLSSTHEYARGLISDQTQLPPQRDAWSFGRRFNVSPEEASARVSGFGYEDAESEAVFLVRTAAEVPEPATAWLFGSGLIGLAGAVRRRRTA